MEDDTEIRAAIEATRRALLVTIAQDGRPRPVPICLAASLAASEADDSLVLYSPLDEKPKSFDDPLALARARDIARDPRVTLLVDHWDEDWRRLWWVRVEGSASILLPNDRSVVTERRSAIAALRRKYRQYADHALETRPIIRVVSGRISSWGSIADR